jgi:hypothetical protein
MRFLAFFRIQCHMLILRWRWLLPWPVMAFIGYLLVNALKVNLLPEFLSLPGQPPQVNAWDALFIAFGNAYYMVFVIANLFLILVCDSLPESEFGQLALFRLGSRKTWWAAKSLSMLLAAFLYTLLCMLMVLGVASAGLPFRFEWSPRTAGYPANVLLPFFVPGQMSPLGAAAVLFGLDVLGFWALGTLVQVITLFTRRYLYGYFAALLVLLGSFALSGSLINVANVLHLLPPIRNLILTFYPYPFREVPLGWSYVYWGVVLGLLFFTGAFVSRRQNYLANRP